MRKEIWLLCLPLLLLGGCGTQEKAQDPPQIITRKTVQEAKKAETPPEAKETPAPSEGAVAHVVRFRILACRNDLNRKRTISL